MIVNGSTEFAKSPKTFSSRVSKPQVQTCPMSPEHQPRRQPRIFAIPPQRPISTAKVEAPAEPRPIRRKAAIRRESREIPAAQLGRVRALTNYGMTQQQVAELYGVTVEVIERTISRPDYPRAN